MNSKLVGFYQANGFLFTPVLLRYVNNNSAKFVQKFQPEISAKIGKIIKNYLNSAMGQVDAKLMID